MGSSNKGKWYKLLIDKMDNAISNGYYFEAIFIEYIIIDDRIKSLAELAGIPLTLPNGTPKMLGKLIGDLKKARRTLSNPAWGILDIVIPFASYEYISSIMKKTYPQDMIIECTHAPRKLINASLNAQTKTIASVYNKPDTTLLEQIRGWSQKRNNWMHAAGDNALTESEYESEITPLAIDGASFAREICDATTKIKRRLKKN